MRFTEREMTVAVEAVARTGFEAMPALLRRRVGAAAWDDLSRAQRYRHLVTAGDLVLEALVALPERPTIGSTPSFTDEEYDAAAQESLRARAERRSPGSWDKGGQRRRRRAVESAVGVLRLAVAAMPVRQDPDALVVPDHL